MTTENKLSLWDRIGHGFAAVAHGAAKAALWASEHPTVVQAVSGIAIAAGAPAGVVAKVDAGINIAGAAAKRRETPSIPVVLLFACLASAASASAADRPDAAITPGATVTVTTADLCVPGYSKRVRNVPESVKRRVYATYGITSHKPGAYEVDHLISLELGGSNDIANLWPQPYTGPRNAHQKDALENRLHWLVCHDRLSLANAQHAIATDWVGAYQRYILNGPTKGSR